ncbi:MAG: alpha-xylosidase [Duncaniella sp.]|nr:alpha-xylosidase [Duncaniella sp.]
MKALNLFAAGALLLASGASAEVHTNGGRQYLLSQTPDVSADFSDFSNHYFFADSLAEFDTATGRGRLKWKRQQLMPRQAFNANTYLHQPLKSLDFPDTAYENDPVLDFEVTPVADDILRVRVFTSGVRKPELKDDPMMSPTPREADAGSWRAERREDGTVVYKSAKGELTLEPHPWRMVLRDSKGRELTRTRVWADNDSTQVKAMPFAFIKRGADNSRSIAPVFSLRPGERIYGLGESPTTLDKAGQKVNLFVTDPQGPETADMYKPIPFFMSDRGYGMFMHTSAPVTADFGNSYIGSTRLYMADEEMDIYIFLGDPKEILSAYTSLTGRPELPPEWSFGTWVSRITYFTEQEGRDVAAALKKHRIPADVIHFDTGWFDVDWQCDYAFSPSRFKDAEKMLGDLKKEGYHVSLWQLPYFTPKNKFFPELVEKGLYVHNGAGTLPYEDVVLDFTNPATVEWYQDKIAGLLRQGVGAIKVDFGEGAPVDAIYSNGRSGLYEHNLYPVRYNKAVADVTRREHGENIIWARSAWAGSQRYPLHWGGDAATTDTGLEGTLRAGLSLGLSGFTFWSHDIGGFVTASPEGLYRRWLPFGFLTSHSRIHGAPPTEPWLISEEFTDYFRRCAEMKYSLMPYILEEAKTAAENGWPMMRALFVEYPDDPGAWLIEDEYLFGSKLLVAPQMEEGNGRKVYLPTGPTRWIDYQTREAYAPGWHTITYTEEQLPIVIMVPEGTTIKHIAPALTTAELDETTIHDVTF